MNDLEKLLERLERSADDLALASDPSRIPLKTIERYGAEIILCSSLAQPVTLAFTWNGDKHNADRGRARLINAARDLGFTVCEVHRFGQALDVARRLWPKKTT